MDDVTKMLAGMIVSLCRKCDAADVMRKAIYDYKFGQRGPKGIKKLVDAANHFKEVCAKEDKAKG